MSTDKLQIIIDAQFKGKGEIDNANKSLKQLDDSAGKSQKAVGGLGTAFKTLLAGGALLKIGSAMLQFGKDSIAAASFVEESSSKFAIVFGDMAESVTADLNDFAAATGQSRYQFAAFAATIGDTLKPMGFTVEAAGDLSVSIVKLATDLASFNNMPVDEALRRLQSTMIGNHENALAFGVIINENTLKQELAAMGADKLTGAMLEQAKAQARYNLLIRGTTDAQGDAIRTADSYANQQKALASAIEELSVSFGQLLLPAATATVGVLRHVATQLTTVSDVAGKASGVIDDIVESQIAQAESTEDLVAAYKRATDQLNLYGGVGALMTGTTGDLVDAQKAYASAILDSAKSSDEYIAAMRQLNLIGHMAHQMTEEQAEAFYENETAMRKAAKEAKALAAQYLEMEKAIEAAYAPTTALTEAIDDNAWSLYEWSSAVGMQIAQAKLGAQAMKNRVAEMEMDAEATRLADEATRAYAATLVEWYTTAINSADAAFVLNEKTGEMTGSIDNANQQLYNMIAASGSQTPEALALLGVALGTISEEAANAALKSMLFTKGLESIVNEALEGGPLTMEVIQGIQREMGILLDTIAETPDIIDLEFETNAAAKRAEVEELMAAARAAAGVYRVEFEYVTTGAGGTGQAGTPTGPGQGPPLIPALATGTGGRFWSVPNGYPNDSYPIMVQSGEDIMVRTPADRAAGVGTGGGMTINIDARGAGAGVRSEIRRAIDEAFAVQGRNADSRIRGR